MINKYKILLKLSESQIKMTMRHWLQDRVISLICKMTIYFTNSKLYPDFYYSLIIIAYLHCSESETNDNNNDWPSNTYYYH